MGPGFREVLAVLTVVVVLVTLWLALALALGFLSKGLLALYRYARSAAVALSMRRFHRQVFAALDEWSAPLTR